MPADLDFQIRCQIYLAMAKLGTQSDLLSIVGSWGDTLTDETVLDRLRHWNEETEAEVPNKASMPTKAELTLEQLHLCRRALLYMYGAEGVEPEHASLHWLAAAITEAERVDTMPGWTRMSERAPDPRQAWYAVMDAGEPDPSTDEWVFFPHRGTAGEWGWDSGASALYYREIGPLPEEESCHD